jgi:hypothetical protein
LAQSYALRRFVAQSNHVGAIRGPASVIVYTDNPIRVDDVKESMIGLLLFGSGLLGVANRVEYTKSRC